MTLPGGKFVFFLMTFCLGCLSQAAVPSLQASQKKMERYILDGVIRGGEAAKAFSFKDLRWAYGKDKKLERLIFEFGDEKGLPIGTRPGYFQASVDRKSRRVSIDFSQVVGSKLDQKQLKAKLKSSPYISHVQMLFDPTDSTLTLSFDLKRGFQVEIYELPVRPKGGRLAMDIQGI